MKLAVAQFNPTLGDLAGNAESLLRWARQAYEQGAKVLLCPELAICGYPPEDLLLRSAFIQACDEALSHLAQGLADLDLHVVIGHPRQDHSAPQTPWPVLYNSASVLHRGQVIATYDKQELPNYQVFDEKRYFTAGHQACVFEVGGLRLGLNICEDAWFEAAPSQARAAGAQVLLVLNASPFHIGKTTERVQTMRGLALQHNLAIVYAHGVGAQDELVFDGGSFAMDAQGQVCMQAPQFEETLAWVTLEEQAGLIQVQGSCLEQDSLEQQVWQALVLGLRDYVRKNRFPGALIGLSGGIDSALVLALAVDALGPERVRTVMMPSPYTAEISWVDARDMAQRLGVRYDEISIVPMVQAFQASLQHEFAGLPVDATEENIQARVRGTLLMALSNKFGGIVLTTGNKSEMATGYSTLYGDMAGGLAVIKDIPKTLVYRLARWKNAQGPEVIPERIITRPPSAELRPDQKDQDSLPPYEVLDAIVERYMEQNHSIEDLLDAGFEPADVERVTHLIKINEYKRRQAPIGLRITPRAFGRDWRYPITSGFRA